MVCGFVTYLYFVADSSVICVVCIKYAFASHSLPHLVHSRDTLEKVGPRLVSQS